MKKTAINAIMAMLFLFVSGIQAQNLDFTWGDDIDLETEIVKIIHRDDQGHYVLTNKRKAFFIEYYSNPTFKKKFSTELIFPEINGKKVELDDVHYMEGNLLLFTSFYDKKTKTQNTFAYKLDEKGKIASEKIDIFNMSVDSRFRTGETELKFSRDKSKMLAIHSFPMRLVSIWLLANFPG